MLVMVGKVREMLLYLANTDGDRQGIQVCIKSDQEPRIHRGDQEVKHPMIFIEYDCSVQAKLVPDRRRGDEISRT